MTEGQGCPPLHKCVYIKPARHKIGLISKQDPCQVNPIVLCTHTHTQRRSQRRDGGAHTGHEREPSDPHCSHYGDPNAGMGAHTGHEREPSQLHCAHYGDPNVGMVGHTLGMKGNKVNPHCAHTHYGDPNAGMVGHTGHEREFRGGGGGNTLG